MVGKYMELHDAYISIVEALKHGGIENRAEVEIQWIDAEGLTRANAAERLGHLDGIVVPGGFGQRGIEGKVEAIQFAREHRVPFLGLCLGLQCCVIEFARHCCNLPHANSSEFDENTPDPVITILDEQKGVENKGGTMRLGAWACKLVRGSRAHEIYGCDLVYERHRHRFEVNPRYHDLLRQNGLVLSGLSPDEKLVEIVELPEHPFYLATQFHPEFKSRPNRAHPLFREFIKACIGSPK
jgi:CTP synthase